MLNGAVSRVFVLSTLLLGSGCQYVFQRTQPQPDSNASVSSIGGEQANSEAQEAIAIETAIIEPGSLLTPLVYTGTTAPAQDVMLRAEVAGELLEMAVDVGDAIRLGQYLAQIDDELLSAEIQEQQSELAALEAELVQATAEVNEARVGVEEAQLTWKQAQLDNERLQRLAADGVVPQQEADLAQTAMEIAEKAMQSAEEQVRTRQAAMSVVQQQIEAQQAVLAQAQKRQSSTVLTAPITGKVLRRFAEPGTNLQVGDNLLRVGNFDTLNIDLQLSELDIGRVQLGQTATVTLDAFPGDALTATISRVSPSADPVSRLIPVEISLPNPNQRIGSGLLARVAIAQTLSDQIVIPQSALEVGGRAQTDGDIRNSNGQGRVVSDRHSSDNRISANVTTSATDRADDSATDSTSPPRVATVFILNEEHDPPVVMEREVELGEGSDRLVEVTSGLQLGESIVIRSDAALTDNQPVRLSILSE